MRARVVAAACILHLFGCDDAVSHVYEGRLYREDRDCLATTSVIDTVEGSSAGTCAAACLVGKDSDGSRAVYLSTRCAPYPKFFDTSGKDPACARAEAASARGDTCLADGGSTHPPAPPPPPPSDAGTD